MAKKPSKLTSGLAWMVRRMGIPDAVKEFKEGLHEEPPPQDPAEGTEVVAILMEKLARLIACYRKEYGSFPRALADLTRKGLVRAKNAILGPDEETASAQAVETELAQAEESDYVYLPPADNADEDLILMYEPPDHFEGKGTQVTLVSGEVVWLEREEFERRLQRTLAAAKASSSPEVWENDD